MDAKRGSLLSVLSGCVLGLQASRDTAAPALLGRCGGTIMLLPAPSIRWRTLLTMVQSSDLWSNCGGSRINDEPVCVPHVRVV